MNNMKRIFVFASLLLVMIICLKPAFGQGGEKSGKDDVMSFMDKYKDVKGFSANTFVKGEGLGIVKAQMGRKMGKTFMKGVTIISMVDYSEAAKEVCDSIHADYGKYFSKFLDVEVPDSSKKDITYSRTFLMLDEDKSAITDFITIFEDKEVKVFLYMGGIIKSEDLMSIAEAEEDDE
jgi:hypothetical protein